MAGRPTSVSAGGADDVGVAVVDDEEQAATSDPRAMTSTATAGIGRALWPVRRRWDIGGDGTSGTSSGPARAGDEPEAPSPPSRSGEHRAPVPPRVVGT
jgi:hypothetical protein